MKTKPIHFNPREKWLLREIHGNNILNLGYAGSHGELLHQAIINRNPHANTVALDINQKKVLSDQIQKSVVANILNLPIASNSFDAIVLTEVIEHFYNITRIFDEVYRICQRGGRLYITTPNTYEPFRFLKNWFIAKQINQRSARKYLADNDHKIFWEPLSLINMLNHYGFKIIKTETRSLSIPYIVRELDLNLWPFNRLSEYLCIVAKRK